MRLSGDIFVPFLGGSSRADGTRHGECTYVHHRIHLCQRDRHDFAHHVAGAPLPLVAGRRIHTSYGHDAGPAETMRLAQTLPSEIV